MPAGGNFIFSPMPSSSDALGPRVTKFGTQVKTNKGYSSIQILGGPKIRGVKIVDFRKISFSSFLDRFRQNTKNGVQKIFGVKILDFRNFEYSEKNPLITILIYKAK